MASNAEMFQFVSTFGPMLGELAARIEFMEMRLERLEGGAHHAPAAPGGAPAADDVPDDSFEILGQKVDLGEMLKQGMPEGGLQGLMARTKNWKPPASAAAPAPPSTTPPTAPTT